MIESESKVELSAPASEGAEAVEKKPARRRVKKAEEPVVEVGGESVGEPVEGVAPKPRRTRAKKTPQAVADAVEAASAEADASGSEGSSAAGMSGIPIWPFIGMGAAAAALIAVLAAKRRKEEE